MHKQVTCSCCCTGHINPLPVSFLLSIVDIQLVLSRGEVRSGYKIRWRHYPFAAQWRSLEEMTLTSVCHSFHSATQHNTGETKRNSIWPGKWQNRASHGAETQQKKQCVMDGWMYRRRGKSNQSWAFIPRVNWELLLSTNDRTADGSLLLDAFHGYLSVLFGLFCFFKQRLTEVPLGWEKVQRKGSRRWTQSGLKMTLCFFWFSKIKLNEAVSLIPSNLLLFNRHPQ